MYYIFDLDHTVVDSSHRQLTSVDGSLDLQNWIANCTKEKILADKVLPIAKIMRSAYRNGHTVIICTARVLSVWDHVFLADNNLRSHAILSRAKGDDRIDHEMKRDLLLKYFSAQKIPVARWTRTAVFYDDNQAVLDMANKLGISTRDAITLNKQLGA
jgi:NurA-like 5'-3' nuclease